LNLLSPRQIELHFRAITNPLVKRPNLSGTALISPILPRRFTSDLPQPACGACVSFVSLNFVYINLLYVKKKYTACSGPEHALSHDAEMRASTLKNDHMKKTKNVYMKW
jgi:hypothetical protein